MKTFNLMANILVMLNGTQHLVTGRTNTEALTEDESVGTLNFMTKNFSDIVALSIMNGPKHTVLTTTALANSIPTFYLEEIK